MKKEPKFLQTPLTKLKSKVSDFFSYFEPNELIIMYLIFVILLWI